MSTTQEQTRTAEERVYDLAGAVHRVVVGGSETGGTMMVAEVTFQPGARVPRHSGEREDLVWYVVDGELEVDTPESTQVLRPGESAFFARGQAHGVGCAGPAEARAIMVATPAGIEEFFRDAAELAPAGVPPGPPPPEAVAAFAEMAARHGISVG